MEIFTAALDIFEILFDEVWEFYKVQLEFSTQSSRSSETSTMELKLLWYIFNVFSKSKVTILIH